MKYTRLVAYGCSFTAGTELVDHLFYNSSEDQLDEKKRNDSKYFDISNFLDNQTLQKVRLEEKKHSYAAHIANNLDLQLVNNGIVGASNDYMIYCYERDRATGKLFDTDLILFGLTSNSRWFFIDNDGNPCRPMLGYPHPYTEWRSAKLYKHFINTCGNPNNLLYNQIRSIKYIDAIHSTNKNVMAANLHSSLYDQFNWSHREDKLSKDIIDIYTSQPTYECIIDNDISFDSLVDWNNKSHYHGGMHPKEKFHIQLADHLSKIMIANIC